jgi:hypothetical protein
VTLRFIIIVVVLLSLAALAVAIATDVIVTSRVSNTASFHELQGIQGAYTTQSVVLQKKAKKAGGHEKEQKELDQIRGEKLKIYQTVTAAERARNLYIEAMEKGNDATSQRADLEARIPEARALLPRIQELAARDIEISKILGADEAFLSVIKTSYKSMETAINTLQIEELTEEQIAARERDIQIEGRGAIHTASLISGQLDADDLEEEEIDILEQEVIEPGEDSVRGLGDLLSQMPAILFGSIQGMSEGIGFFNEALGRYNYDGGLADMARDLSFNQGAFSRRNMSQFQKRIDSIGAGVHQFLNEYSPFIDGLGRRIGREADADPLGYGSNIIIRFQDLEGRYYILREDEGQHLRVVADKLATKWNSEENEIRTMIILDYDNEGVEEAVKAVNAVAGGGYERYVRESRIVYLFKVYFLHSRKGYLRAASFQNADGQELYSYEPIDPYNSPVDIIRRNVLDYRILETITVVNPPKNKGVVRSYFGDKSAKPRSKKNAGKNAEQLADSSKTDASDARAKPDKPPSKPKASKKGSIESPADGVEVLESLGADNATLGAMILEHDNSVKNFNDGKYALALRTFGRAAKMHDGNYLDSYWAALAAHYAKNNGAVKEWLDRCLSIKSDYLPALEMKKALKLK